MGLYPILVRGSVGYLTIVFIVSSMVAAKAELLGGGECQLISDEGLVLERTRLATGGGARRRYRA
jgi:hypothetical protein